MVQVYASMSGYAVPALSVDDLGGWKDYYNAVDASMQEFARAGLSTLAEALRLSKPKPGFDPFGIEPLVAGAESPHYWIANPELAKHAKPTARTPAENPEWNCLDHGDLVDASAALMASAAAVTATLELHRPSPST